MTRSFGQMELKWMLSRRSVIRDFPDGGRGVSSDILFPPATKLGQGYVFTRVCDSVRGVCSVACWDTQPSGTRGRHPREQTPPMSRPSQEQKPPPRDQAPPRSRPPQCSACWERRATSGRYASYWNAIEIGRPLHPANTPTRTPTLEMRCELVVADKGMVCSDTVVLIYCYQNLYFYHTSQFFMWDQHPTSLIIKVFSTAVL